MATNGGGPGGFHPYWSMAASSNAFVIGATAVTAALSTTNAIGHPLDGASVYVIDWNLNTSGGPDTCFANAYDAQNTKPAGATRWGRRFMCFWQKSGNPSSAAMVFGNDPQTTPGTDGFRIACNTDGTVSIVTGSTTYTPTKVFSNSTWYLFEAWVIYNDSAGNALTYPQFCVRVHEGFSSGSPPTTTTVLCNSYDKAFTTSPGTWAGCYVNDNGTHGAVHFYTANPYMCWEDADSPFGIVRIHAPTLSGAGTDVGTWTNTYTSWDDTPTASPDDATTTRISSSTTADKGTSKVTGVPSATIGASDTVLGVLVAARTGGLNIVKGALQKKRAIIRSSGGSETVATTYDSTSSNTYVCGSWYFKNDPGGGAWTNADIGTTDGTLEVGIDGLVVVSGGGENILATAVGCNIVWQKSGETVTAVPLPHVKKPQFVRQAVNRAATY